MKKQTASILMLACLAALIALPAPAQNPCNPCGKTAGSAPASAVPRVAVNPCFAKSGTVFHVNDSMGRDSVTFESEAPLEDIVGTTNAIGGYVVFDPDRPEAGVKAEFLVSVASLATGIPLRDEHLRGADWLDAESHPHIGLSVNDTSSRIKRLRSSGEFDTYEVELQGTLFLHGASRQLKIPTRLVYMPESDRTRTRLPGNLLAARSTFEVDLADFGITGPAGSDIVGTKVGRTIRVSVSFTGTTAGGGANPCGAKNPCAGMNPCNPCGAKNPCNPCGK